LVRAPSTRGSDVSGWYWQVILNGAERKHLDKLQARYDALRDNYPNGDPSAGKTGKPGRSCDTARRSR